MLEGAPALRSTEPLREHAAPAAPSREHPARRLLADIDNQFQRRQPKLTRFLEPLSLLILKVTFNCTRRGNERVKTQREVP